MRRIECEVSEGLWLALEERRSQTGATLSEVVDSLLTDALELERHTLFQVSTSNALVQGVFGGAIRVGELLEHGDFGLGTFADLDGEMVTVDGECFAATGGGVISRAGDDREVPYAVMTKFTADLTDEIEADVDLKGLTGRVDQIRPSDNIFLAIRVDGAFDEVALRAICRARPGEGLVDATEHQSEYTVSDVIGTLVGFWSPEYSKAVSVPGYHFHFITDDRTIGGHVLGLRAKGLEISLHTETDLHLALPETAEFLSADLAGDHQAALARAETGHGSH